MLGWMMYNYIDFTGRQSLILQGKGVKTSLVKVVTRGDRYNYIGDSYSLSSSPVR